MERIAVKRLAKQVADEAASTRQAVLSASNRLDSSFIGDGNVNSTKFAHLSSLSSNVQNQLNAKQPKVDLWEGQRLNL